MNIKEKMNTSATEKKKDWTDDPQALQQIMQQKLFQNAVTTGEPIFVVARDILASMYANSDHKIVQRSRESKIQEAMAVAKEFLKAYNATPKG